jgi:hypothetical protein
MAAKRIPKRVIPRAHPLAIIEAVLSVHIREPRTIAADIIQSLARAGYEITFRLHRKTSERRDTPDFRPHSSPGLEEMRQ